MHELYALKDMLCKELKEYGSKGELSAGTLDIVDKLAHATKNLCKVIENCEGDEYSNGSYDYGMSNRGDSSYARGRGRGARRDSMGRYASDYAGESGYSRTDEVMSELRGLMNAANDEHTKSMVRNIMRKMDSM